MRSTIRVFTVAVVLSIVLVVMSISAASANRATSGDWAFIHYTTYFSGGGSIPFDFTSHTQADTDYDYDPVTWIRVYQHLMGTSVTNGKYYPFPFVIAGPHIYYLNSNSTSYFDVTSGNFNEVAVACNPSNVCRQFQSGVTFYMQNPPISADSDILIDTGVQTIPRTHYDNPSPYYFQ